MGNMGAMPTPPPMQTTVPKFSISVGCPSGPATVANSSPSFKHAHLHRGFAHLLKDECDGLGLSVIVGDGERNALGLLVRAHDDKLSCFGFPGHLGSLYYHQFGDVAQGLLFQNFVHDHLLASRPGCT